MTETTPPAPPSNQFHTLTLEYPIQREGGPIAQLTLRKPKGGELRGLNIQSLMAGDVVSVITLLPRISMPIITAHEASQLEAEDIAEAAGTISLFFMSKAQKRMVEEVMGGSVSKD
ncbi:phage tail assembly protein [Novosphingobium sp.]|uniref:phage tail assembly protein n=1 Tax=Novosphingobium sp. TaxID=1874826 RepID=UPI001DF17F80|nr:phage tail assembly protein [Novosphingobium sp.]MBX9661914.1 phage tail assembly protein [Novosphingobium sp.]